MIFLVYQSHSFLFYSNYSVTKITNHHVFATFYLWKNSSRTDPRRTFPQRTFPRRTVPWKHVHNWQFSEGQFVESKFRRTYINPDEQFLEWYFFKRTFLQIDISPNHTFFVYLHLSLPIVYKVAKASEFQQKIHRITVTIN